MSKEFRITGKQKDYRAVGDTLPKPDREGFYELMGRPEFRDMKKAVDVYGATIAECLDEERLRNFLEVNGWEENDRKTKR